MAGLCSYEDDDLPSNYDEILTDGPHSLHGRQTYVKRENIRLGKTNTLSAAYRIQTLWGTDPRITEKPTTIFFVYETDLSLMIL